MRSNWKRLSVILLFLAAFVFALSGCSSSDGSAGATGAAGKDLAAGTVSAAQFSFDDLKNIALDGSIISASTVGDRPVVKFRVINKATGEGIRGLRTFALHIAQLKPAANGSASYWQNYLLNSTGNTIADPVTTFKADGTVNVSGYSVVDNGDGTYVATFGSNIKTVTSVPYDASLVHRVVIGVRSVAVPGNYRTAAGALSPATATAVTPGAYGGPVNPLTNANFPQFTNTNGVNLVYDFTPSATGNGTMLTDSAGVQTFARDIVTKDACNKCHYRIEYGTPPRGNNTSGHFGSRPEIRTCVVCHTPQLGTGGTGNFTTFIHQIHMGEELPIAGAPLGVDVSEMKYAQSMLNCASCHQGTVANSATVTVTRRACGSCHNNVDFATGANHGTIGSARTDDSSCVLCHPVATIAADHVAVVPPNADNRVLNATVIPGTATNLPDNANTNASYVAAAGILPPGANRITYVISSVARNATTGNPSITFKFQKDGTDVVFNTYPAKAEMMDNFVGAPSAYFVWSVPQDGIAAPADYNASANTYIKNIWRGDGKAMTVTTATGVVDALAATAAGTMTGPVNGYYTLTLTGINIPATAKMLTGGIGYSYSLTSAPPLVQTNVSKYPYTPATVASSTTKTLQGGKGGLSVPAPNVWKVATGFTGRRVIVDNAKCNACHGALGVAPTYHSGQRNDAPTCTFCHTVNRTNSGWPVNINYDVHALHGANMRNEPFSWEASAGLKYWTVAYPGVLKNCEMCHVPGFYDFSNGVYTSTTASVVPNLLMTTAASGALTSVGAAASSTAGDTRTIATIKQTKALVTAGTFDALNLAMSPYVVPGTDYGLGFAYNAGTGTVTNNAAATTIVLSPISAACSGCHDSTTAKAHMVANGGTVFGTRAAALASTEQCLVCHGPANNAAFNETVAAIKTVHRWW
jgi:OmcA/MtrC family decaheme c-type cytochrome